MKTILAAKVRESGMKLYGSIKLDSVRSRIDDMDVFGLGKKAGDANTCRLFVSVTAGTGKTTILEQLFTDWSERRHPSASYHKSVARS
jgi:hypothetical protein